MGFFSKKKKEEKTPLPWRTLTSIPQLDTIKEMSNKTPVVIFKHSTRCGISRMVLRQFEQNYTFNDDQIKLFYLDLLNFRDVSDAVGYTFQILHQSPQLLVVKKGTVVAHASHHSIQAGELEHFL